MRHRFGAAGDHDVGFAQSNAVGGHGDGLQAGRAEAVDGHTRYGVGQAGEEGADAGHVHALFGFRHGAADDDILDPAGVEIRDFGQRGLEGIGQQVVGAVLRKPPLKARATGVRTAETI